MLVPLDGAARDLEALLDGEINGLVGDDDVSALGKGWNDRRDGRERLRVDDDVLGADKGGNVLLDLGVYVYGAETSAAAAGPSRPLHPPMVP